VERRLHDVNSAPAFRRLRSEIVSSVPAPQLLSINNNGKNDAIVFAPSHDGDGATMIYAQHLQERLAARIPLPSSALEAFTPEASSSVALFNPRTKDCVFVDQLSSTPITLLTRQRLTNFVVIPIYDLNDDPRAKWQIGITTVTSAPTLITVKTLNPFPTPPASPRSKPRQSVSFVLPLTEEKQLDEAKTSSPSSNGTANQSNTSSEDMSSSPLPSPSPDSPGATSLALLSKAQQSLVHRAQITFGDGRLFATFSILAWIVGAFIRRIFRTFLPLGVQSRLDGLVWYLLPRTTGSLYSHRKRRSERRRTGSNAGSPRLSNDSIEINDGASIRTESVLNGSAREESTTHLFIDPMPLTASPSTIESADFTIPVPSSPSFAPSRTESTKAARWDIPATENNDRHGGNPTATAAAPNSTLHLLVRKPPGGVASPHNALYVELDGGTEFPLGPDLLRSSQGHRALKKKAKISDDPAAATSPSELVSVFAIQMPEPAQAKGTSVLVRLRA